MERERERERETERGRPERTKKEALQSRARIQICDFKIQNKVIKTESCRNRQYNKQPNKQTSQTTVNRPVVGRSL